MRIQSADDDPVSRIGLATTLTKVGNEVVAVAGGEGLLSRQVLNLHQALEARKRSEDRARLLDLRQRSRTRDDVPYPPAG